MNEPHKTVEVERKDIQQKSDSSMVASTFIKYAAYVLIFSASCTFSSNMYSLNFNHSYSGQPREC